MNHQKVLQRVSWVFAAYCLVVVALLAGNLWMSKRVDPLEVTQLEQMQLQLAANPKDEALRTKLRAYDRRVRDGYFRHRQFAINGSLLLAFGLVGLVVVRSIAESTKPRAFAPDLSLAEVASQAKVRSSQGVFAVGILLAGGLIATASVARHDTVAAYAKHGMKVQEPQEEAPKSASNAQPLQPLAPFAPAGVTPPNPLSGPIAPTGGTLAPFDPGTQLEPVAPKATAPNQQTGTTSPPKTASQGVIEPWAPSAWRDEWPRFRGPFGNGVATSALAVPGSTGSKVLWKVPTKSPGWNSPIVFGDKIFIAGADATHHEIVCFGTADGKELWRTQVAKAATAPTVSKDTGHAPATMATDGARVYAIFTDGNLVAVSVDGKPVWSRAFGKLDNMYGHASSLVCYGSGLIVQLDQGTSSDDGKSVLYALDSSTGKTVWEVRRAVGSSWATPVVIRVNGKDQLVALSNPLVIGYDPANGKEIWRVDGFGGEPAPSPTYDSNRLVVAAMGSYMFSIDPSKTGDISKSGVHWDASDMLPDIVSPLIAAGLIYSIGPDGTMVAFDASNRQIKWEHSVGTVKSSPVLIGDNIWFIDHSGTLRVIEAGKPYKEIATLALGEEINASPAVVRGRMYIRGKDHLFCIGP